MRFTYYHFIAVDSTNTWAKRQIDSLSFGDFAIITAETQTCGRGRDAKNWYSPPNQNLYLTYAFFVEVSYNPFLLSQLASLSICDILTQCGASPKLKWPNDVLIGNKKIAGVLTEVQKKEDKLFVALGIGLNVNMGKEESEKLFQPATSLFLETGETFSIEAVEKMLTNSFFAKFQEKDPKKFQERWQNEVFWLVNTEREFLDQGKKWSGKIKKIEKDGTLILESGKIISAATIVHWE